MKNITFNLEHEIPMRLLSMCPTYRESPLSRTMIGNMPFWLKDESNRMGLGSFKALGGAYAVLRLIIGDSIKLPELPLDLIREKASRLTFVCASAGNHGIAVASGARLFGAKARVHLSTSVPSGFAARLERLGALVISSGSNYEESILAAIKDSEQNNHIHLADGSWPLYTEIPRLVMEGYTVIPEEMRNVFEVHSTWPSHVFLQAGVGGMAAAIVYMIRNNWAVQPEVIIVEPDRAPCLKASVDIGHVTSVRGALSNMGRLDCKTPSILAFEVLHSMANQFVTISDETAQAAANELTESGMPTTPSGAAGYAAMKEFNLPIGADPLVIVSEGLVK